MEKLHYVYIGHKFKPGLKTSQDECFVTFEIKIAVSMIRVFLSYVEIYMK